MAQQQNTQLADRVRAAGAAMQSGQQVAERGGTIFDLVQRQAPAFKMAMPRMAAFDVERFVRVALTTLRMNPKLLQCDQQSLLAALMLSAQLGLEPGGPLGHAYLVPYGRELTFIVGYKGYMELARRSGRVASIYALDVREGDAFKWSLGLHRDIVHEPAAERGALTHVYAVATYKDGSDPDFVVLDRARIDSFRKRSKASGSGPWVTDYDAMALKTAIRRLATWLPLSVEMASAAAADEQIIVDSSSLDIIDQPALPEHAESTDDAEPGEKREPTAEEAAAGQGTLLEGQS